MVAEEASVVSADVFFVSVEDSVSDVVLDFSWVGAVEWVSFGGEVVQAATKRPNVYLGAQLVLLAMLENLWGRVVEVAAKTFIFQ